jgi:esterase/lipase superfamily enzyme
MPATVYFATNRSVIGPPDQVASYSNTIVAPSNPGYITYATAFVNDAGLTADTVGAITSIHDIKQGGFSQPAITDLSAPGRDLLIFIHGFDNSFENAITRAAFNQQWFHAGGADCAMVAFSWPSLGQLLSFPVPWADYLTDQTSAKQSGMHIMAFFANLQPIIAAARAAGQRVNLLCHSMGNWALQAAVESWFSHGQGPAALFDTAVLAAADEVFNSFAYPPPGRLSQLRDLAGKVRIYYSRNDGVLHLSHVINGVQRLGEDGPQNSSNTALFPPGVYTMIDCTGCNDYAVDFASSHQYYRRSPGVRTDIATAL